MLEIEQELSDHADTNFKEGKLTMLKAEQGTK